MELQRNQGLKLNISNDPTERNFQSEQWESQMTSYDHCYKLNRMVSIMVTDSGPQKECPGGSGSSSGLLSNESTE